MIHFPFPQRNAAIRSKRFLGLVVTLGFAVLVTQVGTLLGQTINVSEDAAQYEITITLEAEKNPPTRFSRHNQELRLSLGEPGTAQLQEQTFELPAAAPGSSMQVERHPNQIRVTVPKSQGTPGSATHPTTGATTSQSIPDNWNELTQLQQQMMNRIQRMKDEMQRFIPEDAPSTFPSLNSLWRDMLPRQGEAPRMQLQELNEAYIVRVPLPEEQAKNMQVTVEDNRFLRLTTKSENSQQTSEKQTYRSSQFSSGMTLPGPVKSDQITVLYENGELQITLPKS